MSTTLVVTCVSVSCLADLAHRKDYLHDVAYVSCPPVGRKSGACCEISERLAMVNVQKAPRGRRSWMGACER
jgi:hypothetical protein